MSGWWIAAFLGVCAVVAVQAVVTISLLRITGVLLVRTGPNYARAFTELPWGERAPTDALIGPSGERLEVAGRPLLVTFVSAECSACREIGPALRALAPRYADRVRFAVVVEGARRDAERWGRTHRIPDAFVAAGADQPREVTEGIVPPYAILLDGLAGVAAHGIVNDREMIESLLLAPEPHAAGAHR